MFSWVRTKGFGLKLKSVVGKSCPGNPKKASPDIYCAQCPTPGWVLKEASTPLHSFQHLGAKPQQDAIIYPCMPPHARTSPGLGCLQTELTNLSRSWGTLEPGRKAVTSPLLVSGHAGSSPGLLVHGDLLPA